MKNKSILHSSKETPWFVNDPYGDTAYYKTEEEAITASKDAISYYLEDVWDEAVVNITVGKLIGVVEQTDVVHPTGKVDEEGIDEVGESWNGDYEYKCDYELVKFI